jgi:hypothetical protein
VSETRKTVVMTVVATFEGDYIPANQAEQYLEHWIDSGLEDRDDLRGWELKLISLVETDIPKESD